MAVEAIVKWVGAPAVAPAGAVVPGFSSLPSRVAATTCFTSVPAAPCTSMVVAAGTAGAPFKVTWRWVIAAAAAAVLSRLGDAVTITVPVWWGCCCCCCCCKEAASSAEELMMLESILMAYVRVSTKLACQVEKPFLWQALVFLA